MQLCSSSQLEPRQPRSTRRLPAAPLPSWFKTYDASYQVSIETGTLTMKDGTPLAVTFFKPVPKADGERFPVVLEMLPYHKDDYFYARDFAI